MATDLSLEPTPRGSTPRAFLKSTLAHSDPPALGMMGTVISMVAMFEGLQTQKDQVGLRLSVAMTATFVGLLLANTIIAPLGDRLAARQSAKKKELDALFEILVFINSGEPLSFLREEVKSRAA